MSEQVQVREGVWRTRDGREIVISLRDFGDAEPTSFVWFSKSTGEYETWLDNGRNTLSKFPQPLDLIEYVRPLPGTQPTPEPEPVQVRPGIWKTREGHEVEVRRGDDNGPTQFRWVGVLLGINESWRDDGRWSVKDEIHRRDLVAYVGPLPAAQTTTDTLAEIEEQSDEPEPALAPQPGELRPGVWRTRDGRQVRVFAYTDAEMPSHPWVGVVGDEQYAWMRDGRFHTGADSPADLVAYLRPFPKSETTTETLVEIEQQAAEDLQQWMEATALQRRRLEAELSAMTAERDRLQQAHQTMTEHARELLESGQQARDQRDNLAQRLWTKPSEEALQKRVAKQNIEINTLQDKLQDMTDDRETLRRQFVAMTADRDRLQAELARETESLQNERFQAQTAHAGCKRAEEHLEEATAEVQRLTAELRQAQTDLDAERETPAANCRAVVDAHLVGAQSGRQAAFEAVERWVEPLAAVDSEHAAAILQALPGCIRKLAELEGVTW